MIEVIDNEFSRQFQYRTENEVAFVEYSIQDRKIFFTKSQIPENFDTNFSDAFFKSVVEKIVQKKYKIVPTCAEAVAFFRRNKDYKEFLSAGIRI